jgi:hypothetical protein
MGKRRKHSPSAHDRAKTQLRRPNHRRPLRLLYIIAVLIALIVIAQIHYLIPDSAGHIAYARSLLWDLDVDFSNDYKRLGMIDREEGIEFGAVVHATKKPGNPFGMGSALLWLPFLAITGVLAKLFAAFGADVSTDGFGTATLFAAHLGTWTFAILSVSLMAALVRELLPNLGSSSRRASLIGALLGMPLIYYVFQLPSYSHVCAMFSVTLLLYLSLRWRGAWTTRRAVLLGACLGLAGLVRVQELGFWIVPILIGCWGGALRSWHGASRIAVYTVAAGLIFLPQLVAWGSIYGSWWHVPQGGDFLQLSPGRFANVLFATHHGLLAWSPIVVAAIAGWILLLYKRNSRGLGIALLAGFLIQWFVNTLPCDWWAGWSFGARRFIDCIPLVAIGLAAIARSGQAVRTGFFVLAGANIVQWLRVGTGALSGQPDPGWNELWGTGFLSFLPRIPGAMWESVRVHWTYIKVLQSPDASPPAVRPDTDAFLAFLAVVWIVGVLSVSYYAAVKTNR